MNNKAPRFLSLSNSEQFPDVSIAILEKKGNWGPFVAWVIWLTHTLLGFKNGLILIPLFSFSIYAFYFP